MRILLPFYIWHIMNFKTNKNTSWNCNFSFSFLWNFSSLFPGLFPLTASHQWLKEIHHFKMSDYVDSPVLVDLTTPTQSPRSEQDSDVEIIEINEHNSYKVMLCVMINFVSNYPQTSWNITLFTNSIHSMLKIINSKLNQWLFTLI